MENDIKEDIIPSENTNEVTVEENIIEKNTVSEKAEPLVEEKQPVMKRSKEEELAYFEGRAKRLRKDLGLSEPEPLKKNIINKTDELDLGAKAYLKASGIEPTEFEFVQQTLKDTGKDIDSLLNTKWFKSELQERREYKANLSATPSTTTLQGEKPQNKVDYWIDKSGLPEDRRLAQEVVEARYKLSKGVSTR